MKHILTSLCLLLTGTICNAQYLDEIATKLHDPKELRKDVDFVHRKLEKEHVNLYHFISEKQLDYKFDSLKKTIDKPMISMYFSAKLLTVLSTIGDGHLSLKPDISKLTPSDMEVIKANKMQGGISTLDYLIIGKRLYIKQNNSDEKSLKKGDEILSIDNVPTAKVLDTLMRFIPSDGYNKTFKTFVLNQDELAQTYKFMFGKRDTTWLEIKTDNGKRKVALPPAMQTNITININNTKPVTLKFLKPDSSIAYLKVRTFMLDTSFKGFETIFKTIRAAKSKTMVLDLRGNTGGIIGWSAMLFSYLTTKPTYFFNRPEELIKNYLIPGLNKIRDRQIDWYKQYNFEAPIYLQQNGFWGDLYVLVDGGTFSSSSLLASNLKLNRAATLIGEETGGSRNIWTAGQMKSETLPESKLNLSYGILPVTFGNTDDKTGRGIMPDIYITYTIDDFMARRDLELDWVMKDMEGKAAKK